MYVLFYKMIEILILMAFFVGVEMVTRSVVVKKLEINVGSYMSLCTMSKRMSHETDLNFPSLNETFLWVFDVTNLLL